MTNKYNNPALPIDDLLQLLHSQGLRIDDTKKATHRLKTVSFHRLSAYFAPYQTHASAKQFTPQTSFDDVWKLYVFDRELRLLIVDALERVEVTFRTAISDSMSRKYHPHWYLEQQHFKNQHIYNQLMNQINEICQKQHEPTIRAYYKKYNDPKYPPSWIIIECLSFGACASLFRNLAKLADRKEICEVFGFHPTAITSWMDSLRYVRNLCAHHSRLWNRWFTISPKLSYLYGKDFNKENTFYAQLLVIDKLMQAISPGSNWKNKLKALFEKYPYIPFDSMGFNNEYLQDPFWV